MPDQDWSDHVVPDQVVPDHVVPDQVVPDQVVPDQVVPDQVVPFQSPPDHVVPWVAIGGQMLESNVIPKMSCSPSRTTPLSSRWSLPRESSRLPVPVELVQLCSDWLTLGSLVLAACERLRVPAPSHLSIFFLRSREVVVEVSNS